jgi:hypothetical protein
MSDGLQRILKDEELQMGDVRSAIKDLHARVAALEARPVHEQEPEAPKPPRKPRAKKPASG